MEVLFKHFFVLQLTDWQFRYSINTGTWVGMGAESIRLGYRRGILV